MIKNKIIAKRCEKCELSGDTFQIAAFATEAKRNNPNTIDGTVGSFKYNDCSFKGYNIVNKTLNTLKDNEMYSYAKTDGGIEFKKAILKWVFNDDKEIINNLNPEVVASPGGTGAINTAIFNSLDFGESILIPHLRWNPYVGLATTKGVKVVDYNYLCDGIFDIEDLYHKCLDMIKIQNKIVIILNDPCNNPTGYSLSIKELEKLIHMLNGFKNVPINLIYDIAYMDYLDQTYEQIRERFSTFKYLENNIMISVCFSASKTFCIYGLRVGAVIYLSKNNNNTKDFYKASCYSNRHTWSNCNKLGLSLVTNIINNDESRNELIREIDNTKKIIKERYIIFENEAKEVDLPIYPYSGGFFTAVKCDNPQELMEKLFKKDVFLLNASQKTLRVAICSITLKEIKGLAKLIKEQM